MWQIGVSNRSGRGARGGTGVLCSAVAKSSGERRARAVRAQGWAASRQREVRVVALECVRTVYLVCDLNGDVMFFGKFFVDRRDPGGRT